MQLLLIMRQCNREDPQLPPESLKKIEETKTTKYAVQLTAKQTK